MSYLCAICRDEIGPEESAVAVATGEVFHTDCTGDQPQQKISDYAGKGDD